MPALGSRRLGWPDVPVFRSRVEPQAQVTQLIMHRLPEGAEATAIMKQTSAALRTSSCKEHLQESAPNIP